MKTTEIFVIKNMVYRYGFNKINNERMKVFIDVEYQVENVSNAGQEYSPVLQIEESDAPEILQATYVYGNDRVTIPGKDTIVESNRRGVIKAVGHKQFIEPKTQGHTFFWHYSIVRDINDSDMMAFGSKTHGLRVVSNHDPNQLTIIVDDEYGLTKLDDFTWTSSQEFVAGQHIRIRWFEK